MRIPRVLSPSGSRGYAVPSFTPGASAASPNSPFVVFDRAAKRAQRDRAASDKDRSRLTDYVKDEVAGNMVDRLLVSRARRDLSRSLLIVVSVRPTEYVTA